MKALLLPPIFCCLAPFCCLSQPQEVWVARYNGGFTNKTHTALALRLDSAGNIYVAGSSQNASNLSDYVLVKYAPDGTQLYATRYSSTNGGDFTVKGFALDENGNTCLTGTGGTVKFDGNGGITWTAPYAGNDVAVDANGNVHVTGFMTVKFATIKLSPTGSNAWLRLYADGLVPGDWRTESQKVAVDHAGRVYVAGWEAYGPAFRCSAADTNLCRYFRPSLLAYDAAGDCLWTNAYTVGGAKWGGTVAVLPDKQQNVYVTGNGDNYYQTARIGPYGQVSWNWVYGPPGVRGMALDPNDNVFLTGGVTSGDWTFREGFGTFKRNPSGGQVWQSEYFGTPPLFTGSTAAGIALDALLCVYTTGVSTNSSTGNDFATIKYDPDGHQLWVKRYNGPANGNDGATSIAVAPDGSIYVTGYSANASGGSDIVTIKYVMPTTIHKESSGSMLLQGQGAAGSNYTFQAATNLLNWGDIGSSLADSNGLFQFTDTNAPLFPYRFYRWYVP